MSDEEKTVVPDVTGTQDRCTGSSRPDQPQDSAKLTRALRALNNSNHALLHATDEGTLLQQICKIVTEDCGHALVWIGFADDDEEKSVRPVAHAGFEAGYLESLKITWADTERGRGPTGTAIRTRKPSSCRNMLADDSFAPWREEALRRGYASSLVLPLIEDDRAFGALTIYSRVADSFSKDEIELLTQLASDLAYGITALRLRVAHTRATEALRRSEAEYRAFFETVAVGAVQTDLQGRFVQVNDRFCQITGYSREELLGMEISDLWLPEERERNDKEMLVFLRDKMERFEGERRHVRKDGQVIWVSITATSIMDDENRPVRLAAVVDDVSQRRKAEEALLRSEKLASVGRMAATIAHEINNPLAAVMNALFLASRASRSRTARQYLEMADQELQRVAHLTRQALGFYRESRSPGMVPASAMLDSAIGLLQGKILAKEALIEKQYDTCPDCLGVPGEMRQLFSNLLSNSLDAIQGNAVGRIRVHVAPDPGSGGRRVRVNIADNGQGIDAETGRHLFEPFFTTKAEVGTGLGLWISRQIVEKHQGAIRIRSRTSGTYKGTLVSVTLPAITEARELGKRVGCASVSSD